MQYQTARAMCDTVHQKGGLAGIGAGMAVRNTMAKQFSQEQNDNSSNGKVTMLRELNFLLDEGILISGKFNEKRST